MLFKFYRCIELQMGIYGYMSVSLNKDILACQGYRHSGIFTAIFDTTDISGFPRLHSK